MKLSKLSRDDQEIEHFDDFGFDGTPFDRTAEYVPTKPFPSSLQVVAMFAIGPNNCNISTPSLSLHLLVVQVYKCSCIPCSHQ